MLIFLPILILVITPVSMLVIRALRPGFVFHWLIAVAGAGLAWPLVMLAGRQLPSSLELGTWQPESLFPNSPFLLLDQFSWPFAAGIVTILLAVLLTDVTRSAEVDWSSWSGELTLAAAGLIAVLSGNPLTLLLAWTAIDFLDLTILLGEVEVPEATRGVVVRFAVRLVGSFFLLAAGLGLSSLDNQLFLSVYSPQILFLLLVAGGLRLGVLPMHLPFSRLPVGRRGLAVMTLIVPSAAALILIVRSALTMEVTGVGAQYSEALIFLAGIVAVLAAGAWLIGLDEFEGRHVWVLVVASLALASAIRANPAASLAWGLAVLFGGSLLFLASFRGRRISMFLAFALIGISAVPFSPTWNGASLFAPPFSPILILFLVAQVLLVAGYARFAFQPLGSLQGLERWMVLIYPLGIGLLLAVYFIVGWLIRPSSGISMVFWIEGPVVLTVALLSWYWLRGKPGWNRRLRVRAQLFLTFDWLKTPFHIGFQLLDRLVGFITLVLEGEGGLLWVLLLTMLVLLLLLRP